MTGNGMIGTVGGLLALAIVADVATKAIDKNARATPVHKIKPINIQAKGRLFK